MAAQDHRAHSYTELSCPVRRICPDTRVMSSVLQDMSATIMGTSTEFMRCLFAVTVVLQFRLCDVQTGHCTCHADYYGKDCHFKKTQGWYSHAGSAVYQDYGMPQLQINTNPATKAFYQRRSCYRDTFGTFDRRPRDLRMSVEERPPGGGSGGGRRRGPPRETALYQGPKTAAVITRHTVIATPQSLPVRNSSKWPTPIVPNQLHPTYIETNVGESRTRYYDAFNDTFYLDSDVRYEESGRMQLTESTSVGDLSGSGERGSLNYRTTTEVDKVC